MIGEVKMKILYIGEYFSDDPAGRYYTDGDGSGEEFREEILKPLFSNAQKSLAKVIINIDKNVEGYGSSFLVEAFAGLIKHGYFKKEFIQEYLEVEYNDEDFELYAKKIKQYINEAVFNSVEYNTSKPKAIKDGLFNHSIDKAFLKAFL